MNTVTRIVLIGGGATAFIDLWALVRRRTLGVPLPDYAMVGRWLAHMLRGRFRHDRIAASASVRGERGTGWLAHYATGIAFAAALAAAGGLEWIDRPTLGLALVVGIASVAAPFLWMHPAMGLGIAASRAPRPAAARLHSLVTHAFFGLGLYLCGWIVAVLVGW